MSETRKDTPDTGTPPVARGTVRDGDPTAEPGGYYGDRLKQATTDKELRELDAELARHGYGAGGRLRTALAARLADKER